MELESLKKVGIPYELNCARRKTLSIRYRNGTLIIGAPFQMPHKDIDEFIEKNRAKVISLFQNGKEAEKQREETPKLTSEQLHQLADEAVEYIPKRVEYYAEKMGVTVNHITIRNQKTRWGSCSSNGRLNFNCLLMLAPKEVIDAVVVHELAHRKEMNHSDRFYKVILDAFPDYHKWNAWLKEHGKELLMQMA